MKQRIDYELKIDKKGHKYALRIGKDGKKKRIVYKTAQKRLRDVRYHKKVSEIEDKLEKEGAGATYKEYQKAYKTEMKNIVKRRKKATKPPLSDAIIRSRAKRNTIKYHTGIACKYHYMWEYRMPLGTDDTGMDICDDSPVYEEGRLDRNGSEDYEAMCEVCWDVYEHIVNNMCKSSPLLGGACVVLYQKIDGRVLDQYELPETGLGCNRDFGFSFRKK